MVETLGLVAAFVLPLFNIPLIVKIEQRKSSKDFSLFWVFGVWVCMALMLPSGLRSTDAVYKIFSILNLVFFTAVTIQVMRHR